MTRSGKPSAVSRRRRSIHSRRVSRVASKSAALSASVSCRLSLTGESRARWRIVGERVADPAEHAGVGEDALEGVVLARERRPEGRQVDREHLEPARVLLGERGLSPHRIEGRPLLRARLREEQGPRREVEGGQAHLSRNLRPARAPVEPPRDHQVEDQEQLLRERDHEALAEPPERAHRAAHQRVEGWVHGAEEEGARQAEALERLAEDPGPERVDVHLDVRQLRHAVSRRISASPRTSSRAPSPPRSRSSCGRPASSRPRTPGWRSPPG